MVECITVSVNYSDCLELVIRQNRRHLSNWVVATVSGDRNTIEICKSAGIHTVFCDDVIHKNDAVFNKGAMINKAYQTLSKKDWILHLDSDMLFPHNFHQVAGNLHVFDKNNLYGMHRWQVPNKQSAVNYIGGDSFPHGAYRMTDDCAIGFFQLFHASSLKPKDHFYSEEFKNAAHSDNEFRDRYRNKGQERFIEHFDIFHLGQVGVNWDGRKSAPIQ